MWYFIISVVILTISCVSIFAAMHNSRLRKERQAKYAYWRLRNTIAHEAIQKLKELASSNNLVKLFDLHKSLADSLELNNNHNLGPCPWGYFRTKDIKTMTTDEVFLGDTCGLFTKPLSYWATCTGTMAGNGFGIDPTTPVSKIIFNQYYGHLMSNFRAIESESLIEYQKYV